MTDDIVENDPLRHAVILPDAPFRSWNNEANVFCINEKALLRPQGDRYKSLEFVCRKVGAAEDVVAQMSTEFDVD